MPTSFNPNLPVPRNDFRTNAPLPRIDFAPQPQANFVDSIMAGMERGQSLGLRQRQIEAQQQELELARKAQEDKDFNAFSNSIQAIHKIPGKIRAEYWNGIVVPQAQKIGLPLSSGWDESTDAPILEDANQLIESHIKHPDKIKREDVMGGLHLLAIKAAQAGDSDQQKSLMDMAQEYKQAGGEQSQFVGMQGNEGVVFNPKTKSFDRVPLPGQGPLYPKNLTDQQVTSTIFATRASDANRQLDDLIQGGFDPTAAESGIQKILPNYFQGENAQALEQLGKNFVASVLRKESGAAINEEEWKQGKQQYIPQPGDKPKTLRQKEINRQRAIQGFLLQSGGALPLNNGQDSLVQSGPKPGTVSKGYLFKGGDPADKSNWVKQ